MTTLNMDWVRDFAFSFVAFTAIAIVGLSAVYIIDIYIADTFLVLTAINSSPPIDSLGQRAFLSTKRPLIAPIIVLIKV